MTCIGEEKPKQSAERYDNRKGSLAVGYVFLIIDIHLDKKWFAAGWGDTHFVLWSIRLIILA